MLRMRSCYVFVGQSFAILMFLFSNFNHKKTELGAGFEGVRDTQNAYTNT